MFTFYIGVTSYLETGAYFARTNGATENAAPYCVA